MPSTPAASVWSRQAFAGKLLLVSGFALLVSPAVCFIACDFGTPAHEAAAVTAAALQYRAKVAKKRPPRWPHGSKILRAQHQQDGRMALASGKALLERADKLGVRAAFDKCSALKDGLRCPCRADERCSDDPARRRSTLELAAPAAAPLP